MATQDLGKIQGIYRGDYASGTLFEALDTTLYNGVMYFAIADGSGNLPTDTNFFRPLVDLNSYRIDAVTAYVISQYADGDETKVATIAAGLDSTNYDYFIYAPDFRVYAKGSVTGTFSSPLDFDPDTGIDSGLSGGLTKVEAIIESEIQRGLIGNYEEIVASSASSAYTGGTFNYPNSHTQDDYEMIVFAYTNSATPAQTRETIILTKEIIASNPTTWSINNLSGSSTIDVQLNLGYFSSTSFSITSSVGGGALKQVIGYLKEGV